MIRAQDPVAAAKGAPKPPRNTLASGRRIATEPAAADKGERRPSARG